MFENKFSEIINFVEGKIWLIQSFNKNGCFLRKKISSKNVKFYINQNPVESIKNHYHCSNSNYECNLGRFHTSVKHKDDIFSAPKIRQFNIKNPSVQRSPQFNTQCFLRWTDEFRGLKRNDLLCWSDVLNWEGCGTEEDPKNCAVDFNMKELRKIFQAFYFFK